MTALLESAETTAQRFTWGDRVQVRDGEHADARGFVTDLLHRDGRRLLAVRLDDADGGELVTFAPAALVIPRRPVQDGLPPFTDERAEWIRVNVLGRINGTLTPHIAGQRTCLHLPEPVCSGCRLGYHGACTGQSWGDLHATWIRDHSGSHLFWQDLGDECQVWVAPRPCECGCERRVDEPAAAVDDEGMPPLIVAPAPCSASPARVADVQLDLFEEVAACR